MTEHLEKMKKIEYHWNPMIIVPVSVHFSKKRSKKKMDKVHDKMLYAMFIEPSLRWVCEKELTAAALVSQAKLAIVPNKIESLHYKN